MQLMHRAQVVCELVQSTPIFHVWHMLPYASRDVHKFKQVVVPLRCRAESLLHARSGRQLLSMHCRHIVAYVGMGTHNKEANSMFLVEEALPGGSAKHLVIRQLRQVRRACSHIGTPMRAQTHTHTRAHRWMHMLSILSEPNGFK